MIASMMPRTGWAHLWVAFPFVVAACSAACLLKAADPASGVTPAADPPAVLPPPIAGRAAISPAAPIIPGETVAALQDGNHEAARGALVKLRENAKDPDERAYLGYLQGITGRLAGHTDAARATLRAAAAENPTGRWLPKIRFELAAIELGGGNLPVAEELARSEAIRLLSDDRKDRLAEVYHAFARRLLEPDDPVIQPDPHAAWGLLSEARDLAKSPVLRAAPLRDGPHQPDGGVLPQGDRILPGLPQGVSRRSRSAGRSISPWRVPAPIRSVSFGPPDLGRSRTRHRATATFPYAQILQGQQKFNEAIAAWKGYLATFPNGPQSADAQRAILDTQLLVAADHLNRARYPEARAAWSEFVAQNPLDPRVPGILFQVGESFLAEKKFDAAIAVWGPLTAKFPGSEPAGHAHFVTASLFETEKGDPAGAIERFKKIAIEPWRSRALQRVAVMEARALTVHTLRAFRTGEVPSLKIMTRNLEKLTFTAYKLNPEAYFRKKACRSLSFRPDPYPGAIHDDSRFYRRSGPDRPDRRCARRGQDKE